jgi:hypothetical protein
MIRGRARRATLPTRSKRPERTRSLFDRLKAAAKKKARGQLSPVVCIEAIEAAVYAKLTSTPAWRSSGNCFRT